jgi:hypothetical protein
MLHHPLGQLPVYLLLRLEPLRVRQLQLLLLLDDESKDLLLVVLHLSDDVLEVSSVLVVLLFEVPYMAKPVAALVSCFLLPYFNDAHHLLMLVLVNKLQLLAAARHASVPD